jgi:hypothetical protein
MSFMKCTYFESLADYCLDPAPEASNSSSSTDRSPPTVGLNNNGPGLLNDDRGSRARLHDNWGRRATNDNYLGAA